MSRGLPAALLVWSLLTVNVRGEDAAPAVSFTHDPGAGRLTVNVAGAPLATYVYRDPEIRRPYFSDVHAHGGVRVTRRHPPGPGDPGDHPTMHPGLWLAFGDLGGSDFWRNKAAVVHERFTTNPTGGPGAGGFTVSNRYVAEDGKTVVCRETARINVHARPGRSVIVWRSEFRPEGSPLVFGDQEEMGLGLRLATPLAPKQDQGGRLLDSADHVGERAIRGTDSAWCAGVGRIDGHEVAVTIVPDPSNFRPSWWHARDYGLIVANPFGRAALTGGPPGKVTVPPGEVLKLGFAVAVESAGPGPTPDSAAAYRDCLKLFPPD